MAHDDSRCRKSIYCDFVLSRDLYDATIEVCSNCGKKVIYRKREKGRIDNKKYLRDHIRSTVQPFGRTKNIFFQIYGNQPLKNLLEHSKGKKSKEQIQKEWEELRREIQKPKKIYR